MNDQEENLWEIHKLACEWVRFADSKASIILTAQGVMASFTVPEIMPHAHDFVQHSAIAIPILLSALCALVSCYFGIRAITPRLKVGAPNSNIYFGHIAMKHSTATSFHGDILGMVADTNNIQAELSSQIWANCKVAWRKYNDTWWAVRTLSFALLLALIAASANFYYLSKVPLTGG